MGRQSSSRVEYYLTFGLLMVLLVATVGATELHLGNWALPVSLGIAALKVALIALVFMHLGRRATLFRIFAITGVLTCSLLFILAGCDYLTRPQ